MGYRGELCGTPVKKGKHSCKELQQHSVYADRFASWYSASRWFSHPVTMAGAALHHQAGHRSPLRQTTADIVSSTASSCQQCGRASLTSCFQTSNEAHVRERNAARLFLGAVECTLPATARQGPEAQETALDTSTTGRLGTIAPRKGKNSGWFFHCLRHDGDRGPVAQAAREQDTDPRLARDRPRPPHPAGHIGCSRSGVGVRWAWKRPRPRLSTTCSLPRPRLEQVAASWGRAVARHTRTGAAPEEEPREPEPQSPGAQVQPPHLHRRAARAARGEGQIAAPRFLRERPGALFGNAMIFLLNDAPLFALRGQIGASMHLAFLNLHRPHVEGVLCQHIMHEMVEVYQRNPGHGQRQQNCQPDLIHVEHLDRQHRAEREEEAASHKTNVTSSSTATTPPTSTTTFDDMLPPCPYRRSGSVSL